MIYRFCAGGVVLLVLAGCASFEPEPCSSEWIAWRTDRITHSFQREYRAELRELQTFTKALEDPDLLTLTQMTSRLEDFQVLATEFAERVVPEIENAVEACETDIRFLSAFIGFLEEQGFEGVILEWAAEVADLMDQT